jgi:alanyl-tRNA synthetase
MTNRLYYTEPYRTAFDATVVSVGNVNGRKAIRLDQTAFYPTSGGQPFDTGTLGAMTVVDVVDADDGDIDHIVEMGRGGAGLPAAGQPVHGVIDWTRRFDHMQQHTGQHVLSAACVRLFSVPTVSFHLGAGTSTIDLSREMTPSEIARGEDEANRIVWEDRAVTIRFGTPEEAARLPLRKEPVREGTLRLIDVDGFDLSACGGTHVARTGAIGIIAVTGWERFKGGQRLEFACGGRALARFRGLRDHMASAVRLLSVLPADLPSAVERLQAEARESKRAITTLEGELARFQAGELLAAAETTQAGRIVLHIADADANGLKTLASAIATEAGALAVLVSRMPPPLVAVARSADARVDANQIVRSLTTRFGGRGGGKPDLAQGGGLNASPQEILDEARRLILAGG